jgi:hypothetical protein
MLCAVREPDTKGHTVCDPIDRKCLEQVNLETEGTLMGARGWGGDRLTANGDCFVLCF